MQKIGFVFLIIGMVVFASSCSNVGNTGEVASSKNDLSGVYTGKMTFDKINEAFISSYQTAKEKETIKKAVDAEALKSANSLITNKYKNIITGSKSIAKEGSITLNITKNDKSTNIASGDYMFDTIAYNKLLPYSGEGSYWAMYNDKRNGDTTISIDSKGIQLSNSKQEGKDAPTRTYKLDGSISGTKITGTWSQIWDGTEAYGGTFEVDKTAF